MKTTSLFAAGAVLASAGAAFAIPAFTESFADGPANWRGETNAEFLDYSPTGGVVENDGFVSEDFNFVDFVPGGFGGGVQTIFRGEASTGASGGAFVGDWNNLTELSFFVRHDAPESLNFFLRLASPFNFPSVNYQAPDAVAPNTWTQIDVPLDASAPGWVLTGTPFSDVLANIGNVQIGVDRLADTSLPGQDLVVNFDLDRVSVIPTPGAAGVAVLAGLAAVRRRR